MDTNTLFLVLSAVYLAPVLPRWVSVAVGMGYFVAWLSNVQL